ncbi:MAG: heavy metal translocating P-type ATPase, partial [Clostridia bacterium]|nr:heavy metal translocating P-type ATPase [Clostridia bacterium]
MTRRQKRSLYRIFLSAVLLLAAFIADKCAGEGRPLWLILIFYLPAYFTAGYDVLFRAARNIAHGQVFDENFLMALATVGALCIGFLPGGDPEFAEASFVMIFYQTGELFQSVAVGKSRRSIAALMNIKPETAR